ncbi:hypothetical protein ACSBQT_10020 [Brevibacterium sp. H602]|uniref:hypothetical protein n=1 Tax=unclassified Brevibacterium TaxID=2614124 RepID=UPI00397CD9AC
MDSRPRSPNDRDAPYAVAFAAGGVLAVVYLVVRYLHAQYIGCGEAGFQCGGAINDLFFGYGSWFLGFLIVLGWVATAVIAPSVLNQLRPHTSWWRRGLIATGFCLAVTVVIMVVYSGIVTYSE